MMEILLAIIILILFLAPYFAVPLMLAYRNVNHNYESVGFPFLTTAIILFCWLIVFFVMVDFLAPYQKPRNCLSPEAGFIIFNLIFLIPLSLVIQIFGNKLFRRGNN